MSTLGTDNPDEITELHGEADPCVGLTGGMKGCVGHKLAGMRSQMLAIDLLPDFVDRRVDLRDRGRHAAARDKHLGAYGSADLS
jgi:hypothetical protein